MELDLRKPISLVASQVVAVVTIASLVLGFLVLRYLQPGPRVTANLIIAGLAAIAAGLWAWRAAWRPSAAQVILIGVLMVIGFFLGLLARGEFAGDRFLYLTYQGFPFSWRHSTLYFGPAALQRIPLATYVAEHLDEIEWAFDARAVLPDLLFAGNIGVLIVTLASGIGLLLPSLQERR